MSAKKYIFEKNNIMKRVALIFSFLMILFLIFTQDIEAQKAQNPMGKFTYKWYYKRLSKINKDEKRLKKGVKRLNKKNISTNQLYKACYLFEDENLRLVYVKELYPRITDKSNAILLCDAFEKTSHIMMLWEYIKLENPKYNVPLSSLDSYADYLKLKDKDKDKQKDDPAKKTENKLDPSMDKLENPNTAKVEDKSTTELADQKSDSKIIFPDASIYKGKKGCDSYLNDNQFKAFANTLAKFETDEEKTKICMEYAYKYCFTTSQVMQLSVLLVGENFKYIFFKTAYDKVYDQENYMNVIQLLKSEKLIQEIKDLANSMKGDSMSVSLKDCLVSKEDYEKIKLGIRNESNSTNKLDVAKNMVKKYKCLNSQQIAGILPLFSFEADKIDLAKYAYEFTVDKDNYIIVINYFTSYELKENLKEYIRKFNN